MFRQCFLIVVVMILQEHALLKGASISSGYTCRHGFIRLNEGCYLFENTHPATWTEAQNYCLNFGAKLVSVESAEEHRAIRSHIMKYSSAFPLKGLWTSGNDIVHHGRWEWASTLTPIGPFTAWGTGEPSKPDPRYPEQHCLQYFTYAHYVYQWDNFDCSKKMHFICEQGAEPSVIGL
ncbi:perlucin [Lingula anatina]|uniref:Perlucin n=1 Tax=Lingula anatina TaxID=7574 RepID=A0A1S3HXV6_LINAN|nr:perlucin [Lingula anatina]|eukprot:XP_013390843.1 perlucin [Lingula anatina]